MLSVGLLLATVSAAKPPLFKIKASSLYEAGVQHGAHAKQLIHGYLKIDEMEQLKMFRDGSGKKAFEKLRADNTALYPRYVQEIEGIAKGAGVPVDDIWMVNLLEELENLEESIPSASRGGHCTDVISSPTSGDHAVLHGHNEDWSNDVRPYMYFVSYKCTNVTNVEEAFASLAGLCYPGVIIGNAITFGANGLAYTQNSLFPGTSRDTGIAGNFVQRSIMEARSPVERSTSDNALSPALQQAVDTLTVANQALGFSLNLVYLGGNGQEPQFPQAANVEIWENSSSVGVVPLGGNRSHMNLYKRLAVRSRDFIYNTTVHRQAAMDRHAAPQTVDEIRKVLGDTSDPSWPIYRDITLVTYIMQASSQGKGHISLWANTNPKSSDPVYKWDLDTFWDY